MHSLALDIGNTFAKVAQFQQKTMLHFWNRVPVAELKDLLQTIDYDEVIVSSVSLKNDEIVNIIKDSVPVTFFSASAALPIIHSYHTPHTLGPDRLAAAVGAASLLPFQNVIIVDMGTCIKYDLIDKATVFQGGIIAPGMAMRYKAMHHFTQKLPLFEPNHHWPTLIGKSTEGAMRSGVMNTILAEIEGILNQYEAILTNIKIILTGGDATYFEKKLKRATFVVPELVLIGLNETLQYQKNN